MITLIVPSRYLRAPRMCLMSKTLARMYFTTKVVKKQQTPKVIQEKTNNSGTTVSC